jgi:hypothetical protein
LENSQRGCVGSRELNCVDVNQAKRGFRMAQNEETTIDNLAQQMEVNLEIDYEKKDLKAQRELIKQNLYDGSKKLKHTVPKGKRI